MKIYNKRGKKNYKEQKLINDLENVLSKKFANDSDFKSKFVPANSYDDLKKLYNRYVPTDVAFEELPKTEPTEPMAKEKEVDQDLELENEIELSPSSSRNVDPFNRNNPIIRDYVLGDESLNKDPYKNSGKTDFAEPTSFDEAFEIPDGTETENEAQPKTEKQSKPRAEKREPSEPLNPAYDDMSANKKRKNTKKFAKYIVETVCMLSEKGFVWFATKDINESKLAEYELNGEMDLSLMLTLGDGQEQTVKEFFAGQCLAAQQLAVIGEEQKSDLADALAEVMMEKGVTPTPTQELILISLQIFGGQALTLFAMRSQTSSVLNQLRVLKNGGAEAPAEPRYEAPPVYETPPQSQRQADPPTPKQEIENDMRNQALEQQLMEEQAAFEQYFTQSPNELALVDEIVETKE
jgi:hypothetical protein